MSQSGTRQHPFSFPLDVRNLQVTMWADMEPQTVREIIAQQIAKRGWSLGEFARMCNIPKQNVGLMLRGMKPIRVNHLLIFDALLQLGLDYGGAKPSDYGPTESEVEA